MNTTLWRSKHAFFAAALVAAFVAWFVARGAVWGAREGSAPDLVLWTGWTALVAMLAVTAYSLRKYAHKLRISPEFKLKVATRALERSETRLNELRADVLKGKIREREDVVGVSARIFAEEKVAKVLKAVVTDGPPGGPKFVIRVLPTEPLGRVATWLHVHAWYGLAAGALVLLHGGASCASPLGLALNALTATVVLTGVVGILLWAVGPRLMTAREKDFTFEDAFVQNRSLKRKVADALAKLDPAAQPLYREVAGVREDFGAAAARVMRSAVSLPPPAKAALQDLLVLTGQRRRVQAELARLAPIKFWINLWRAVHVPATLSLFGAAFVHVLQVWRY